MNRIVIVVCLAASLCCTTGCCDKGKNRLDVTLEGPWILYQDTQFDGDRGKVSVLIAIAPTGAVAEKMAKGDSDHHHLPQLSTGDGYYIPKPDIYCLTFDDACAQKGPDVLTTDHYPGASLLSIPYHGAGDRSATWDWLGAAKSGNTVLVLPMPDSYSNDGVFPMHFASTFFDGTTNGYKPLGGEGHSIGLHLHYTRGPNHLNLSRCGKEKKPTATTCGSSLGPLYQLDNNGTLRLQMRAPDNDDGCDRHVRYAYHEVYKIIHNDFDHDYAYIEPAQWDGQKFVYEGASNHKCFDNDPQGHPKGGGTTDDVMGIVPTGTALQPISPAILILPFPIQDDIVKKLEELKLTDDEEKNYALAKHAASDAQSASAGLDPDFPRISQVLRIGQLLSISEDAIDRFEKNPKNKLSDDQRKGLREIKQKEKADTTKNGNDCRAPVVMVQ